MTLNPDHKTDLIDHINDEHGDILLAIARVHLDPASQNARIIDLADDGCTLTNGSINRHIPYGIDGDDPEERLQYLAFTALAALGKPIFSGAQHYYTIRTTRTITTRILRLELASDTLPQVAAGDATCFRQKTLHKTKSARAARERANLAERLVNHLLLWWYRRHKPQKRSDIIEKFNKNLRYYTIAAITDGHLAVDIYLHGESPGSQWARSLKPGDIISAIGHYREHTEHLANGQTLLVADETAYPALAAILARWQNPTPPIILTLSHHAEEQAYFEDGTLPPGSRRIRSRYGDDLTTVLAGLPPINAAWGALEHETAKTIRHYLRHRDHLDGSHNRIKTYWKQ